MPLDLVCGFFGNAVQQTAIDLTVHNQAGYGSRYYLLKNNPEKSINGRIKNYNETYEKKKDKNLEKYTTLILIEPGRLAILLCPRPPKK